MKEKIINLFNKIVGQLKPTVVKIDSKMAELIPNPKIKKILYITIGSLFGVILLIIILGTFLSPLRKQTQTDSDVLNKPNIIFTTPEPQKELNDIQKEILKLETDIKEMRFPEGILNIPIVERDLTI